jgi:glycerol-3-phosphate acyltransferase PlsY
LAWKAALWIAASYLIGSIPFGLLVSLGVYKKDLRKLGSGNIGATNVLRNFGVRPFVFVLILDMGKGIVAVTVGEALGLNPTLALVAGLAAVVGHMWSVFLKFKGGKGIATGGGVIIAAYPWQVTVVVIGVFLVMVLTTRIMSLGSITAATAFPISSAIFLRGAATGDYWFYMAVAIFAYLLIVYQHRGNIKRLVKREEPRISLKKSAPKGAET